MNQVRGLSRRAWTAIVAVVAVVAIVAISVLLSNRPAAQFSADEPTASAAPTPSASATEGSGEQGQPVAPTESPAGGEPTAAVDAVVPDPNALPPVGFEEVAEAAAGFTTTVGEVRAIDGVGTGIGEISGPALAFTVVLTNSTGGALSTSTVVVNGYDSTGAPAIPLVSDPNAKALPTTLAPGESAEGVYVFLVPAEARDAATLSVAFDAGTPVVVFSGPIPGVS